MKLIKISLEGVRNLEDTELDFAPQVNYIFGDNGAGKTSLLEAIHFLAVGRSFRTNRDLDIVKFNAPFLKISGVAIDNNDRIEAEIRFFENTKITYLQHHKQDKLSSYLGWLPIVTILLSDIDLVNGP
ncbi:MAG: AAA family ATPase, partial [candidate division WOR-3 bacterium]|nr:AAA family ATPase [candidate division WOR-3 bacterium]